MGQDVLKKELLPGDLSVRGDDLKDACGRLGVVFNVLLAECVRAGARRAGMRARVTRRGKDVRVLVSKTKKP